MKSTILIFLFTFQFFNFSIEKSAYYHALKSDSIHILNSMIKQLDEEAPNALNRAYKGTLIAKTSSFENKPAQKIKMFKTGVTLLENEISNSPKNVEYRFLRLTIQENCPKILNYNKNTNEDAQIITSEFSHLNKELKNIILDYANNSALLNSSNLK